jgi:hypothetical protein
MPATRPLHNTLGDKMWIAARFVLLGIGGLWLMMLCSLEFIERALAHNRSFISPFLSLPLVLVGAALILIGVGEWRRWAYLCVFLSIPFSLAVLQLFSSFVHGKEVGILFPAIVAVGAYITVRRYYRNREATRLSN